MQEVFSPRGDEYFRKKILYFQGAVNITDIIPLRA